MLGTVLVTVGLVLLAGWGGFQLGRVAGYGQGHSDGAQLNRGDPARGRRRGDPAQGVIGGGRRV